MRNIKVEKTEEMLVLRTKELDGYIYLPLEDRKAKTTNLDDNTCQKTFDCSAKELRDFIKDLGY